MPERIGAAMFIAFQVLTLLLVAVAMATALAHALEWPGKARLDRETYIAVQPIYYPGFTLGGLIGEFGGMVATLLLVLLTPRDTPAFWLTLAALTILVVMHLLYWMLTAPVNKFWLKDTALSASANRFFGRPRDGDALGADWTVLRDRWEASHAWRALLGVTALVLLATALAH
ncbi:hypothetical protein RCO27_05045 [Sphingosinicella sp. LHD-64]|uniref:hypothetical protein n=1 Tax=Sphingosinicella sp. LHD-64 TaxID=3072139 RepID=UPI00280F8A92|nr:hypothetical protein [Sphingosinicella sp. LHD-64]MDQ8755588.1 hypothetical protein [Sphingosinicella sp. LHD-64]